jgi:hypothetical protein
VFRELVDMVTSRLGSDDEGGDGEADRSRFVPSPLDASVRFAHGSSRSEVDRELSRIHGDARSVEERQRDE